MSNPLLSRRRMRVAGLLLAGLAAAALGACNDDITGAAEQVGVGGLDLKLDPSASRGAAAGTSAIRGYDITSISQTLGSDAFNRAGDLRGYITATRPYWEWQTWIRDSIADPRLPAMRQTPGRLSSDFIEVYGPEFFNRANADDPLTRMFELYGVMHGFRGSQAHYVQLVRYGLKVNGQLDQIERLVYGRITQPDSLILLDPNPAGDPAVDYDWTSPNSSCNNHAVPADANPFRLGPVLAASDGSIEMDKCWGSGTTYYRNKTRVVTDSMPFARNSLTPPVITQQYNYVEISEGSTAGGPVVARIQIGADIDPSTRAVIPNSFAPFPTAALSPGTLISTLKVAEGAPNAVRMRAGPLEPLSAGNHYQIVLVNRETGTTTPIDALYWTVRVDTTGKDPNSGNAITVVTTSDTTLVGEIDGGAPNVAHWIEARDTLTGGPQLGDNTDLALVPTGVTGAVPIWAHYLDINGTPGQTQDDRFYDAGPTIFGTLRLTTPPSTYVFAPGGSAAGVNRGDQVGIAFQHLPRPPIGYYYRVWLVPTAADEAPVMVGGLTTPLPEARSLDDADTLPNGGELTPTEILHANILLRPQDVAALGRPLSDFATVRLTLEAKAGTPAIAPIVVLEGVFVTPLRL